MDISAVLQEKYQWLSLTEITQIIARAKFIYISLLYPADKTINPTEYKYNFRDEQWIFMACEEIIERLGISSEIGHRENGLQRNFDNAQISMFLVSLVKPVIGTIGDKK